MARGKPKDIETIEAMTEMRRNGASYDAIGRHFHCSRQAVYTRVGSVKPSTQTCLVCDTEFDSGYSKECCSPQCVSLHRRYPIAEAREKYRYLKFKDDYTAMGLRWCYGECKTFLPADAFSPGLGSRMCRECQAKRINERYHNMKEHRGEIHNHYPDRRGGRPRLKPDSIGT